MSDIDARLDRLTAGIRVDVARAIETGDWSVVDAVRRLLVQESSEEPALLFLLDRLDLEVEAARMKRALPKLMRLAGESGDAELQADLLALARAVLARVKLGAEVKRRNRGLNRQRKITAATYAKAFAESPNGSVADVARRMRVARQNLSDWLQVHPQLRRSKK